MSETISYRPEEYERFSTLSPERNETEILEKRKECGLRLRESIMAVKDFRGRFKSQSELGSFVINNLLNAMQGRVGEADRRWMDEVKNFYMKLTGRDERSWSGVLAEFSAARLIEKSGNVARFPGNLPDGMVKPEGYNEFTKAEQDRLQGIDWWLDTGQRSYAVTVKSAPFTELGIQENRLIYGLNEGYKELLLGLFNESNIVESGSGQQIYERYVSTLRACQKVKSASEQYGTGAVLVIVPSMGNDSNFNRHTGEPSDEVVEKFTNEVNQFDIAKTDEETVVNNA